jgi:hypothetical protein
MQDRLDCTYATPPSPNEAFGRVHERLVLMTSEPLPMRRHNLW